MALAVSTLAGCALAVQFEGHAACRVGMISFCIVALLFLVTQELLIEAHEASDGLPWVSAAFFLGVFATLVMDKATG